MKMSKKLLNKRFQKCILSGQRQFLMLALFYASVWKCASRLMKPMIWLKKKKRHWDLILKNKINVSILFFIFIKLRNMKELVSKRKNWSRLVCGMELHQNHLSKITVLELLLGLVFLDSCSSFTWSLHFLLWLWCLTINLLASLTLVVLFQDSSQLAYSQWVVLDIKLIFVFSSSWDRHKVKWL